VYSDVGGCGGVRGAAVLVGGSGRVGGGEVGWQTNGCDREEEWEGQARGDEAGEHLDR
jgi:hypothetical protein